MALTRVLVTAKQTISKTIVVDEAPTDAGGTVTVTVARLDGTAVTTGSASHDGQGVYSFPLPASTVLDTWTVDWSGTIGGAAVVLRDHVEHVGGFLFGVGEARTSLKIPATVTAATLAARRNEVEQICERICRRAWVPRFSRRLLDGSGLTTLTVPDLYLRTVRAVTTDGTTDDPAAVAVSDEGVLYRVDGGVWPAGQRNIVVEYEHGADYPPAEISTNAMLHLRAIISQPSSGIPDRALSFTITDGGVYRLSVPGADSTGIPHIDAAYKRNAEPRVWIA